MSNVVFFDGVDDYIAITDSATMKQGGDMTIECLFKPQYSMPLGANYTTLLRKGDPYVPGGEWALYLYNPAKTINFVRRKADNSVSASN